MKPGTDRNYSHGVKKNLTYFWANTRGNRHLLFFIVAGMLVDGAFQSGIVMVLKTVIDALLKDPNAFVEHFLKKYVLYGIAGSVLFFPFAYSAHVATAIFSSRLTMKYRLNLYYHLQKLSMDFFHRNRVGEISARMTADIDTGVSSLIQILMLITWSISVMAISVVSMIFLSRPMFLLFLCLQVIVITISKIILPKVRKLSREVRENIGELNAAITEDISAFGLVKSFAKEQLFFNQFRETQLKLYFSEIKTAKITFIHLDIIQVLFLFMAPILILGFGSTLVTKGLSIGALTAFWVYWKTVQSPINMIINSVPNFFRSMASMDRIMEFFSAEPLVKDMPDAKNIKIKEGVIRFQCVNFTYQNWNDKSVLNELNLTIPARSSLGIAGPSGAGKSTLAYLLLRFYDPLSGRITIDDQDIKNVKQDILRSQIGVVQQDTILLSGTIRENMLVGKEDAGDDEIWNALELAGAKNFISEMEKGLDAYLGERGVNLSGGQKQRLAIARVFLKNPPIVIFDEATSALDTITETQIKKSMKELLKNRTSIIIAHRLSTIIGCDQILLMDKGKVEAMGTHSELLQKSRHYAELVNI
jgi:ABC-type multidrug transport system fused ATPase/permease subunit